MARQDRGAMPPAVFTPILGLLGLGLAWRRAAEVIGAPEALGELFLGAAAALWLFAALLYGAKTWRRPAALVEDASALPGRAGLAAALVGALALALALVPFAPEVARGLLVLAMLAQAGFAGLVVWLLWHGPPEARRVTPVWHLTFVGVILAPLVAVPLGWSGLAVALLVLTLPVMAAIYLVSLRQVLREAPLPPLRPLLSIHLAPLSLGGQGLAALGYGSASVPVAAMATVLALVLLVNLRWITVAGFTPFWGAFTFPLTAFASLLLLTSERFGGVLALAIPVLALATVAVPWIAFRILRLWAGGRLAQMTGAARA